MKDGDGNTMGQNEMQCMNAVVKVVSGEEMRMHASEGRDVRIVEPRGVLSHKNALVEELELQRPGLHIIMYPTILLNTRNLRQ